MEGCFEDKQIFEWFNEDLVEEEQELLEISRFLLERFREPSCEGRPIMFVDIEENFGFENIFFSR